MRQLINGAILLISIGCCGQSKYFRANNITDKTEESKYKEVGWIELRDRERIDGYTRVGDSIFGGEIDCNVNPLKGINVETFQVSPGTQYARDKNHVYYPIEKMCLDYEDCGVCYYSKIIVQKANPSTFKVLEKGYAKDSKLAYFRGKHIVNTDGATFHVVVSPEGLYFAVDKNHVYTFDKILKNADPATFKVHRNTSTDNDPEGERKYIVSDKNNEWEFSPPNEFKKVK